MTGPSATQAFFSVERLLNTSLPSSNGLGPFTSYLLYPFLKTLSFFTPNPSKNPNTITCSSISNPSRTLFVSLSLGLRFALMEATSERASEENKHGDMDGEPVDGTYLDLTSFQLQDLEGIELPVSLIELDLTANRLSVLDNRIALLSQLKKLSLRQNLFDDAGVEPISSWNAISDLQELILRDNKLTKIPDASIFKSLLVFDVSFNEIPSLNGLSKVSNTLKELYVSKNEVPKMEELDHLHELQILELGSNGLRVMENLQNLTNLQELWLGRNRIRVVNLCGLKSIKKLSLQSNRLTSTLGFEECVALEELYLSHNGIQKMEGLSTLVNLRVLDISSNKLSAVTDTEKLTRLEDLWLNDNQIISLDGLDLVLSGSREKLTTIYLEHNPCAKLPNYTTTLKKNFPNLQQIDSDVFL